MDNSNRVLELLTRIPRGKVVTYGQISNYLELNSPRSVGRILHNNPDSEKYPCHRVIFADGSLAPAYAFGGCIAQKELLESEGVVFKDSKVNFELSRYNF